MWLLSRLTRNKAGGPAGKKACRTAINDQMLSNCRRKNMKKGEGVIVLYHTCLLLICKKEKRWLTAAVFFQLTYIIL